MASDWPPSTAPSTPCFLNTSPNESFEADQMDKAPALSQSYSPDMGYNRAAARSTRGGPLAAPIGISENLYPVEDSLQAFDPAVFDQPFNGHGASDEWEHMPMRLQAQDASPTLAWQFNHVIEEANLHNGPGFDSTTGFQVDGATFQIDGVTGFPVNSATCQVYGTTGSQVVVAAAVDIYANAAAAATAASTIPYQVNASAPGLFTPTIGNINSAGPALAYTSNTLLPLHVGGRYLCLLNSNKIY